MVYLQIRINVLSPKISEVDAVCHKVRQDNYHIDAVVTLTSTCYQIVATRLINPHDEIQEREVTKQKYPKIKDTDMIVLTKQRYVELYDF